MTRAEAEKHIDKIHDAFVGGSLEDTKKAVEAAQEQLRKDRKIVSADTGKMPESMFGPMPRVTVVYEDGEKEELFQYYPDEISFSPSEFVGLTREEAFQLRHKKDVAYLQS